MQQQEQEALAVRRVFLIKCRDDVLNAARALGIYPEHRCVSSVVLAIDRELKLSGTTVPVYQNFLPGN